MKLAALWLERRAEARRFFVRGKEEGGRERAALRGEKGAASRQGAALELSKSSHEY